MRHWREYTLAHCQHRSGKTRKKKGAKGTHSLECAEFGAVQDAENGKPGRGQTVRGAVDWSRHEKKASQLETFTHRRADEDGTNREGKDKKRWLSRLSGPKLVVSRPSRP